MFLFTNWIKQIDFISCLSQPSRSNEIYVDFAENNIVKPHHSQIITHFIENKLVKESQAKIRKDYKYHYEEENIQYTLYFSNPVEIFNYTTPTDLASKQDSIIYAAIDNKIVGCGGWGNVRKVERFLTKDRSGQLVDTEITTKNDFQNANQYVRKNIPSLDSAGKRSFLISKLAEAEASIFSRYHEFEKTYYRNYEHISRYDWCPKVNKSIYYMPYFQKASVDKIILNDNYKNISFLEKLEICIAICNETLNFHKFGYIHYDIKPQNFIYNPLTKKAFIIDFVTALRQGAKIEDDRGTSCFTHPDIENIKEARHVSVEHDKYSLIISLLSVLLGKMPSFFYKEPFFPPHILAESKKECLIEGLISALKNEKESIEIILEKLEKKRQEILDGYISDFNKGVKITAEYIHEAKKTIGIREISPLLNEYTVKNNFISSWPEEVGDKDVILKAIENGKLPFNILQYNTISNIEENLFSYLAYDKNLDDPFLDLENPEVFPFRNLVNAKLIKSMLFFSNQDFQKSGLQNSIKKLSEENKKNYFKNIIDEVLLPIEKELFRLYNSEIDKKKYQEYMKYTEELYILIIRDITLEQLPKSAYGNVCAKLSDMANKLGHRDHFGAFLKALLGIIISSFFCFLPLASSNFRQSFFYNQSSMKLLEIHRTLKERLHNDGYNNWHEIKAPSLSKVLLSGR